MNASAPAAPETKKLVDRGFMKEWLSHSDSEEIGLMDLVLLEGLAEQQHRELKN